MLDLQLFRIKVYPSMQGELFAQERTRPEILRLTLESLPSAEFREGLTWHLGNVTPLDGSSLYFRLGRTSRETLEVFDEEEGAFQDEEFPTAPYTHGLLDFELELLALAKKTRLAPTTFGIARQFARLLSESEKATELRATFEVDEVKDPEDFITQLREAYTISKFTLYFKRPNAWDAQEDFVKPQQKMLEASNGSKGKVEIKGDALNAEPLEAVARSAAATGDDAAAAIRRTQRSRTVRKQLKGNSVSVSVENLATEVERRSLMDLIREAYQRIRGN